MKIQYYDEDVRDHLVSLQKSKPHLYRLYEEVLKRLKPLDCEEFNLWIDDEISKRQENAKWIKKGEPPLYEFRLPPSDKHEVLRVDFQVLDDYHTVLIINAYIKSNQPKPKLKRKPK